MSYLYLAIAIVAEVVGTSALKATEGFTRLWPSVIVAVGYGTAFLFLSLVMNTIPVGVTYAIWAGMGIVLVTIASVVLYGQVPDAAAIVGMALIVAGVVIVNAFSQTVAH